MYCSGRKFDFPEPITEVKGLHCSGKSGNTQWPIPWKGSDLFRSLMANISFNGGYFEIHLAISKKGNGTGNGTGNGMGSGNGKVIQYIK